MTPPTPRKSNNRLWQARHRAGLEQKHVARLLGHKTVDQVSRYERGRRLPNFQTALKLELIYRTPLGQLFPNEYERSRTMIAERVAAFELPPPTARETDRRGGEAAHVCTYPGLLARREATWRDMEAVKRHTVTLSYRVADWLGDHEHLRPED